MLVESQKFSLLDSIMENSQDLITVKDLNFNYKVCNRTFLKLFGYYHESQVIDKNIQDVLPVESFDVVHKYLEILLDTREPQNYSFKLCNKKLDKIIYQLSVPIVENGEITGILSVSKDITDEENLKLKLVEKIYELNKILEKKKQLESQKELFLATLTHDLKNPVQAQLMSLKMFKAGTIGAINKEQNEMIDMLIESSNYMQKMLYSITNTFKYDNGIITLNKSKIDSAELIQKCLDEVNALAKSRNINIICNIQTTIKFYADTDQLRRVVANIINNGLNYSYRNTDFEIGIKDDSNFIIFEFTNYGEPIPKKIKDHIFDKYVSGQTGIGLGLYFSKKVIEAHNGQISLETDDKMCKFVFRIPINNDEKSSIKW